MTRLLAVSTLLVLVAGFAWLSGGSPVAAQADIADDTSPQEVRDREPEELIRGEWAGTSTNEDDNTKDGTLTFAQGDFSQVTGRFNNWKVTRAEAKLGRRGNVQIILYAPGKSDGQTVDRPITCVGRFNDDFTQWVGTFQGFIQAGTFEYQRRLPTPEPDAVRGQWTGTLTPKRRGRGQDEDQQSPTLSFNLLTGDFAAVTGIVFRSPQHPAVQTFTVTYFDPETREMDLRLTFAKAERGQPRSARAVVIQGIFDESFEHFSGVYEAEGSRDEGQFQLKKRVDNG